MNAFYKILEILGVVAFIAIVIVTILFAEGYQYDSASKDIVKKSVINFALLPEGTDVYLNGSKADIGISKELRLLPGNYELEVRENGYVSWKKQVDLKEDTLVQFPEIKLISSTDNSHIIQKLQPVEGWNAVAYSEGRVLIENTRLHYWKDYIMGNTLKFKIYDTKKSETGMPVFFLKNGNEVWHAASESEEPNILFKVVENVDNFIQIQETGDYFAFLLGESNGSMLVITKKDGSIVFQERGVQSAYVENDKVYYTAGNSLISYSIEDKKVISRKTLPYPIKWLSRVGETYHFLFVTESLQVMYCDEDFENCSEFLKLDSIKGFPMPIIASKTRGKFFTVSSGQFMLLDFEGSLPLLPFLKNLVSDAF